MTKVILGDYYKHRDGGLYKALMIAKSTVDLSESVIYEHVYPFEYVVWSRPIAEWTDDRFEHLDAEKAKDYVENNERFVLREKILQSKKNRKG